MTRWACACSQSTRVRRRKLAADAAIQYQARLSETWSSMHRREGGARIWSCLSLLLASALVACGAGTRRTADPAPAPPSLSELERLRGRAEADWAARGDAGALARAIEGWRQVAELDPARREALVRLAQAQYFLGSTLQVVDAEAAEQAARAFADGTQAAEQALDARTDPAWLQGDPVASQKALTRALYWRALNLHAWANRRDYLAVVTTQDELRDALTACLNADPDYDHAGPDRYLGAFYARPPVFAERDLARANAHFQRALLRAPDFLPTRIAIAEQLAVATQSRDLFESALRRVLEADPDAAPELAPENRLAKTRALDLLYRADEFFE